MYNTENYTEQGGGKLVIGGALEIREGATVTGLPAGEIPTASATVKGGVKIGANVSVTEDGTISVTAGAVAANVPACASLETSVATLNALLAALKEAGLMTGDR